MFSSTRLFRAAPALALAIVACGSQASGQVSGSPSAASAGAAAPQSAAKGPCANPYMPVVTGATWTYAVTNSVNGPSTSSSAITAVAADSFTVDIKSPTGNSTETWSCNKDGLLQQPYSSGAAFSGAGGTATITNVVNTGLTFPLNIKPGDSWTQRTDYSLSSSIAVSGTSTATYTYKAIGIESVSVPAGTFDAMRVDMTVAGAFTFASGQVVNSSSSASTWLVKGKGLAKMTMATDIGSSNVSFEENLQSVQIP